MIDSFYISGDLWRVRFTNPRNPILVDRRNVLTIGVTDPETITIYLSNKLRGQLLNRVLIHELGHATLYSTGLLEELHRMVYPEYWVEAEEGLCNFLADYGYQIFGIAYSVLGAQAIHVVPYHMERLVA
jgi:hypothetical protein